VGSFDILEFSHEGQPWSLGRRELDQLDQSSQAQPWRARSRGSTLLNLNGVKRNSSA